MSQYEADYTFLIDFLEANWEQFKDHLVSMGIPEDEVEEYAVKFIVKLKRNGG